MRKIVCRLRLSEVSRQYPERSLYYGKTPTIQSFPVMLQWSCISGRSKLGRSKLGKKEWKGGSMPFAQLMAVLPLRDTLLAYWISGRLRWFVWCLWTAFLQRKLLQALAWPTAPSTGSSVLPSKTLRRCMPIPISFASDFKNVLKMSEPMYLKCHMTLWYD